MNDLEVNKIIAEYMGTEYYEWENSNMKTIGDGPLYTETLDALVPVWKKLGCVVSLDGVECHLIATSKNKTIETWRVLDNIQQAAAHATAKAIKELNVG